jgi:hypothetical protein
VARAIAEICAQGDVMAEQMIPPPSVQELAIVDFLRVQLRSAEILLGEPAVPLGTLVMWSGVVRFRRNKI